MNLWRFPEQTVSIPGSSGGDQVCSQNAAGTTGAEAGAAASGGNDESVGDYGNSAEPSCRKSGDRDIQRGKIHNVNDSKCRQFKRWQLKMPAIQSIDNQCGFTSKITPGSSPFGILRPRYSAIIKLYQ